MAQGKLIIIDGNDSSGKATQTEKLFARLTAEHYLVRHIEFPDYDSDSSALVKMYLNGKFGDHPDDVNPYAASTFYAVDRFASWKTKWGGFHQQGGIILADRYTTSNMIHQAAKIKDEQQRQEYLTWLWDLEFVKFGLPIPDCVIFLDMPPEYSQKLMAGRQLKSGGNRDIHEADASYLAHCYAHSQEMARRYGWLTIPCVDSGRVKSIEAVHESVYQAVKMHL